VIAVDSNILVHSHRTDSEWHSAAAAVLTQLAEGRAPWAIPWPCVHEFLSIVTHPRIFRPPTAIATAIDAVTAWIESPGLVLLGESEGYWQELHGLLDSSRVTGPRVHDARIAALCLLHGVSEIWTADRDFSSFPQIAVRNPLIAR